VAGNGDVPDQPLFLEAPEGLYDALGLALPPVLQGDDAPDVVEVDGLQTQALELLLDLLADEAWKVLVAQ
jgi:hypothetical protein